MDKLLAWSTKIANGEDVDMSSLTYEQQILLKQMLLKEHNEQTYDDPTLMKMNMQIMAMTINKDEVSEEAFQNRIQASENFLFLIENVDNSSVLSYMKLIDEILAILKNFKQELEFGNWQFMANIVEIVGSSCQNNEPLQSDFMKFVTADEKDKKVNVCDLMIEVISNLLELLNSGNNLDETQLLISKTLYGLSNLIRHNVQWGAMFFTNPKSIHIIKQLFMIIDELNSSVKLKLSSLLQSLLTVSDVKEDSILKFWLDMDLPTNILKLLKFDEKNNKIYVLDNSIRLLNTLIEKKFITDILPDYKVSLINQLSHLKQTPTCWDRLNQNDYNTLMTYLSQ
ncbi:uncharacterized protein HGUI_02604 [Hanseniaspora guilliermondii]|uniref:Hsp70 nucleotide exchange factor FES1 n=1 Tax=Hanseniaspora guilliermondii TaxID=56406 RepID=A0A1L0B3P6_9ASCO|nr:uncharacterized protein HGUI_02604 [Hanseniaspora guilliermondii]